MSKIETVDQGEFNMLNALMFWDKFDYSLYIRILRAKTMNIPVVSCSFSDGEIVIYGEDKVEIQGIWKDWATIKFDDGDTINVGVEELKKLDAEPKYRVGQKIKVGNWSGETEPLEILDIKKTYHRRLQEYCWGYKMNGYTGLTMEYVPEGYLRP